MNSLTIGQATLYQGDALEILPLIKVPVAAVITDPPYASGGFSLSEKQRDPALKYVQGGTKLIRPSFAGDNKDGRSWCHWCALWISLCMEILEDGGYVLMFADWRQLPLATDAMQFAGVNWRGIIPWDKTERSRAPHTGYFRHQAEYIVWGTKGPCNKQEGRGPFPGAYRHPVIQSDKHHVTGKPTPLMTDLVGAVRPGGTVLDPFMGSGTTGVASLQTGRPFIGIEKTDAYFQISVDRLKNPD